MPTTKTTVKKNDKTNEKNIVNKEATKQQMVDNEKEELRQQIEEMKAQMSLMAQMISSNKKTVEDKAVRAPERTITFVNMTSGCLVLKGTNYWEINGRFNTRSFLEREARIIVNNMGNMIRSGLVYISDAEFVEENDLTEVYQCLLSDQQLKDLLKHDATSVIEAYKLASEGQKELILDLIVEEKEKGNFVDYNVLAELKKLSGKDLLSMTN